ncbi:MAG: rRNA maturation RNase YbeY [Arcobacteraceae bacterium]
MIDLENQTTVEIDTTLLEQIKQTLTQKECELIITDNPTIQELNKTYRNINKPTDVLSFPLEFDLPHMPLGSIVISVDYAQEKANEFQHTLHEELTLLFIHGLLHLLGFDHEKDKGEHRAKEEELIKAFNLPQSLIVRNT